MPHLKRDARRPHQPRPFDADTTVNPAWRRLGEPIVKRHERLAHLALQIEAAGSCVIAYLKQLYANKTPELIYYKTLFHIFEKFLGDVGKTDLELGQTSLFEAEIWKTLFEFQEDGTKGAINKILKHNGCVVADGVGLGTEMAALDHPW